MDLVFGTKVYDTKKNQIRILIRTYNLGYVDAPDATGAKVVNTSGRIYATSFDNLLQINDIDEEELKKT